MRVQILFFLLLCICARCDQDHNNGHGNDDKVHNKNSVADYNRTILLFTTVTLPPNVPLPAIDLTTIIDPGFLRQTAILNYYTSTQLAELKNRTFDEIQQIWGYNFRNAQYIPTYGAYMLPGVGLFPYTRIGDPMFPINLDTKHPERSGLWILHQVGWIAVKNVFLPVDPITAVTGVGNYSGLKNLTIAYPGDLLEFGEHNFAHPELGVNKTYTNASDPKYREVVRIRALWSSRQTPNGEGASDTLGKLQCAEKNVLNHYPAYNEVSDHNGYIMSGVHRATQLDGSTSYYGRASWTWPGRNQASVPSSKRNLNDAIKYFMNPLSI